MKSAVALILSLSSALFYLGVGESNTTLADSFDAVCNDEECRTSYANCANVIANHASFIRTIDSGPDTIVYNEYTCSTCGEVGFCPTPGKNTLAFMYAEPSSRFGFGCSSGGGSVTVDSRLSSSGKVSIEACRVTKPIRVTITIVVVCVGFCAIWIPAWTYGVLRFRRRIIIEAAGLKGGMIPDFYVGETTKTFGFCFPAIFCFPVDYKLRTVITRAPTILHNEEA